MQNSLRNRLGNSLPVSHKKQQVISMYSVSYILLSSSSLPQTMRKTSPHVKRLLRQSKSSFVTGSAKKKRTILSVSRNTCTLLFTYKGLPLPLAFEIESEEEYINDDSMVENIPVSKYLLRFCPCVCSFIAVYHHKYNISTHDSGTQQFDVIYLTYLPNKNSSARSLLSVSPAFRLSG
jgi:hypothetical protein